MSDTSVFDFIFNFETAIFEKCDSMNVSETFLIIVDSVSRVVYGSCHLVPKVLSEMIFNQPKLISKRLTESNSASMPRSKKPKTMVTLTGGADLVANQAQKKDIGTILKDMNILPETPNDLQCALCPYKATQKGNLKTHYKLKHLGGADLTMLCRLCQKKCSTKGSLKKHLLTVHNLSKEDSETFLH